MRDDTSTLAHPQLRTFLPEPSRLYRWVVLLFVSLTMGSSYYMYDSINPLERIFIQRLGFTATEFGWLNSAYAVTAILTLLIGGIVIDKIGTKRALTFFVSVCCVGAMLTAVSGRPGMMIAGRAVLGLGGESLVVAATTVIAKWFKGKELSFAFGIKITIARLASVASDNSPTWASKLYYPDGPAGEPSWQGPLLLAVGAGVLAVLCSAIYWLLERKAERRFASVTADSKPGRKLDFRGILGFGPSYWFVVGICFSLYSAIFPFRTFAIDFFTNKILATHGGLAASEGVRILAHKRAGMFASLLPLSAMVATPLLGLLSDKIGKTRVSHDVCLAPVDARLSLDGLHQCSAFAAALHDGGGLFRNPRGNVALGCLYRAAEQAGHCIRTDDPHRADRVFCPESAHR